MTFIPHFICALTAYPKFNYIILSVSPDFILKNLVNNINNDYLCNQ